MSTPREEAHLRKQATYEERRRRALASGTRIMLVACPLCGMSRPARTYKNGARFQVKPDYEVVRFCYGGGRGSGYFINVGEGARLSELRERYPALYENLRAEVERLHELFTSF